MSECCSVLYRPGRRGVGPGAFMASKDCADKQVASRSYGFTLAGGRDIVPARERGHEPWGLHGICEGLS